MVLFDDDIDKPVDESCSDEEVDVDLLAIAAQEKDSEIESDKKMLPKK